MTASGKLSRTYTDEMPEFTNEAPRFVRPGSTADILYLVTARGEALTIPVQQIPQSDDPALGGALNTLSSLGADEEIAGMISLSPLEEDGYLFFATANGEVKRLRVTDLPGSSAHAFSVMNVGEDRIINVHSVTDEDEAVLVTAYGQAIRFKVSDVRPTGLAAGGMRGIKLGENEDRVIGSGLAREKSVVWVITGNGTAKCTAIAEYPVQGRAGSGVVTIKLPYRVGTDDLFQTKQLDLLTAAVVGALEDTLFVLTLRKKSRKMRLKAAVLAPRGKGGGPVLGALLGAKDQVAALTLITLRPPPKVSPPES